MNRFKLVCIGIVMIVIVAMIGSCSDARARTINSYYKVECLSSSMGLRLYRVTVNGSVNYVLRSNNGGLCVLND